MTEEKLRDTPNPTEVKLGTFAGVFTPSVLTILGIILFLRLGFVVGEAGLGRALIIIALANLISILTSLSLSAIATNLRVKGGGDYYVISRTLGPEFGGALGLVLFLAQSVSIAFYCIGFGEALAAIVPAEWALSPRLAAAAAVSALFVLSWLGADWATRFQYVVMALLIAALASFYTGAFSLWDSQQVVLDLSAPAGAQPFWVVFAIFFPAVTGFTQGVSMSGDLKDPGRSIPLGTFLAVGISIVVYFSVAILFAGALPEAVLRGDATAMQRVARFGILVDAGVVAATLSSAMASFLGGPRILQSLASDRIFTYLNLFAEGVGPANNPRRAVFLSAGIAYVTVALGNLNLIAPVVSMFFLISYGLLNYATYFEARSDSPDFRPRFRLFHPWLSLAGALGCLGVMVAVDHVASIVSIAIILAIFQYIKRTAGPSRWADSRRGYHLQQVRQHLLAAAEEPDHDRDWRPLILAFSRHPERRARLLRVAEWLEGRSGMTTLVTVLQGRGLRIQKQRDAAEKEMAKDIREGGFQAFPLVVTADDIEDGVHHLVQAAGIGPLRVNTVLTNWISEDPPNAEGFQEILFGRNLREAYRQGCHVVVMAADQAKWERLTAEAAPHGFLDVWWQDDATGRLMLLLAYLMTRHERWREDRLRVLVPVPKADDAADDLMEAVTRALADYRIQAETMAIPEASRPGDLDVLMDTDLIFLPFRFQDNLIRLPFEGPVVDALEKLPGTVMVAAAKDIDLDPEPEEGTVGEVAAALDRLTHLRDRLATAEKEAAQAAETAVKAQSELASMLTKETGAILLKDKSALARAVDEAEQIAEKTRRKALKIAVKLESAEQELAAQGVPAAKVTDDLPA
ncbi:MAG: amino acid permease [Deltaproteobacteria bacterium]|jgi:amino acid transporter|nr:amino acid permease [Deltaproteobacteria bacterium]